MIIRKHLPWEIRHCSGAIFTQTQSVKNASDSIVLVLCANSAAVRRFFTEHLPLSDIPEWQGLTFEANLTQLYYFAPIQQPACASKAKT